MSQIKFLGDMKGQEVEVTGGWDRPLQEFFLVVLNRKTEDIVWSDALLPFEARQTTERLRAILTECGIAPPLGFWERIERKEANVMHIYEDGEWATL